MKKGFTLTEVLVILAIIGTISAIVIPLSQSAKRTANHAACLQKLRSLGVAVEAYTIDHGGIYPDLEMGREESKSGENEPVLEQVLLDYAGGDELAFHCPSDQEHYSKTGSSYFWNVQMNGQNQVNPIFLGIPAGIGSIPLISDKESFHGDEKGTNFLYADLSVSKAVKFGVDSR